MKKLLGLTALTAALVLSACGGGGSGSNDTVCRLEAFGEEMVFTAHVEDGTVTSITMESRIDISELDDDATAEMAEAMGAEVEGDELVISDTVDEEMSLDEFVEEMESEGATCN